MRSAAIWWNQSRAARAASVSSNEIGMASSSSGLGFPAVVTSFAFGSLRASLAVLDQCQRFEAGEAAGVAQVELGQVVADVAVAAEDLHGAVGDVERDAAHLLERERRLAQRRLAAVEAPSGLPREQPCAVDLDRHLGEQERDGLLLRDLRAERLALLRVVARHLERGARDADAERGE